VALKPHDAQSFRERAALRQQLGDAAGAQADLEQARALEPGNADSALRLARLLRDQGRLEESLAIYRALLADGADPAPLYLDAGQMRYALRHYRRALANYSAAAEADPNSAEAFRGVGLAQRKLGGYRAAVAAFEQYLRLAPDAPDRAEIAAWVQKWR
jgi:tetratricopeptide (TPR) repeat protein